MEEHMHSLEDALFIIQGSTSCKPYPLPSEPWPNKEVERTPEVEQAPVTGNEFAKYGLADVLGSLYVDENPLSDLALFGGDSGSSESLLLQAKAFVAESSSLANHTEEVDSSHLPSEINIFYQAFPFTPPGIPTEPVQYLIESYLPPLPRAAALFETFLQSMSWMFSIVSRKHVQGELIPAVYGFASGQAPTQPRSYGPHDIALLFIVFAIGALVDPSLPPYNVEGQHYHILSRAAMCLQPVFMQRSVVTVKTLNLMSIYNGMCGIESKLENSFSLMNLAAQVALQTGFHKDPSIWGITGREAYDRRTYFWSLLNGTLWQSLVAGRPPVIIPSLIDCYMPTVEEEDMYQSGEIPLGFGIWSFSFTIKCLVPVVEATQGARPPSYDTILALDCKIREFSVPQASSNRQISGQMQAFVRNQLRELALLFLHRGFFVQALADFPYDPLRSPLRQSFLTAYQSAIGVLDATRKQFARQPTLCARVWRLWSFAFSAAITVATVSITRLSIKLEPEPFEQLELACMLFRDAARTSVRAQKALPILLRLRQEATEIRLETPQGGSGKADSPPESHYHWGARDGHGASVDPPWLPTQHPTPSMPHSGAPSAPSSKYMRAFPVPVVHLPLAKFGEPEKEPYAGAVRVPPEWQGLYCEIPSTSLGSHDIPVDVFYVRPRWNAPALSSTLTRVYSLYHF
ncbi:hypothetical protein J3R82DRAFT_8041 [Butyriboletus roseoflavus]|nr:hypothetical protein J3R82DRAFT_8041 [Butyriboletus roseoflavus]